MSKRGSWGLVLSRSTSWFLWLFVFLNLKPCRTWTFTFETHGNVHSRTYNSLFSNPPLYTLFTPKFSSVVVFKCSCGDCMFPRACENNNLCKFGGQTECIMGDSKIVNVKGWKCARWKFKTVDAGYNSAREKSFNCASKSQRCFRHNPQLFSCEKKLFVL